VSRSGEPKTHCPHGHPLIGDNLRAAHGRQCKTCHRDRERERKRARGAKPLDPSQCAHGHPYPENVRWVSGEPNGCKLCHRAEQKARYHANPERHKKAASEYQKANRVARTEYLRAYKNDPIRIVETRRQAREQAYARRVGRDPISVEYSAVLRGDPCSYCGGLADAVDHIVPIANGGGNAWGNLTAACGSCNGQKRTRSLLVFLQGRVR
jgi:5-methylcytosine-specific restriction endonuclease McrA